MFNDTRVILRLAVGIRESIMDQSRPVAEMVR